MKQASKKKKRAFLISGLLLVAAVGATIAYYSSQKDFENEFRVRAPGVAIEEKFNPTDHWVPGEEKSKEVWFTNTGQMDMFLRFSVEIGWESEEHPDRAPEDVLDLFWYGGENEDGCIRTTDDKLLNFKKITQDGKDYFYYEKVLKAGQSTDHVLESVKFRTNLSNDGHKNSDFSDTQLFVIIRGETVLAVPDAVEEWNRNEAGERVSPQIKADVRLDNTTGEEVIDWEVIN